VCGQGGVGLEATEEFDVALSSGFAGVGDARGFLGG
jgi:hypothetical protein